LSHASGVACPSSPLWRLVLLRSCRSGPNIGLRCIVQPSRAAALSVCSSQPLVRRSLSMHSQHRRHLAL
jgi:hypothetical protein